MSGLDTDFDMRYLNKVLVVGEVPSQDVLDILDLMDDSDIVHITEEQLHSPEWRTLVAENDFDAVFFDFQAFWLGRFDTEDEQQIAELRLAGLLTNVASRHGGNVWVVVMDDGDVQVRMTKSVRVHDPYEATSVVIDIWEPIMDAPEA